MFGNHETFYFEIVKISDVTFYVLAEGERTQPKIDVILVHVATKYDESRLRRLCGCVHVGNRLALVGSVLERAKLLSHI